MFMKTMAVGPLEEVASWVTGWTTVAMERVGWRHVEGGEANWRREVGEARRERRVMVGRMLKEEGSLDSYDQRRRCILLTSRLSSS
jgi:hypothetical protein